MATIQDLESADLRVIRGDDGRITSIVDTWGRDVGLVSSKYNSVTGEIRNSSGPTNASFAGVQLCAAMGDSITFNGVQAGSGFLKYSATGFTSWLQALSMGRLWFPLAMVHGTSTPTVNYNKGISGNTTADMLLRLSDVTTLSPKPRFVTVMAGTNDLSLLPGDSAETVFARWKTIVDTFIAEGIIPIVFTILPRGVWGGLSAPQIIVARGKLLQINAYIRAYAAVRPSLILADAWTQTVNFASATSDPIAGMFMDNLHPNDLGGYVVGNVASLAVDNWLASPSAMSRFSGSADAYDAMNNPFGSFVDSSFAAGGGTASAGTSAAGNGVPLGWTSGRQSGATSTMTVAQRARADGVNGYEVLLTTTGTDNTQFRIYPGTSVFAAGNFSAGDAVYAESEAIFSGTGSGLNGNPDMYLQAQSSTLFISALSNSGTPVPGNYSLLLRTPMMIQPSTPKDVSFFAYDSIANGGTSTVIRRNLTMRKYNKDQLNSVL